MIRKLVLFILHHESKQIEAKLGRDIFMSMERSTVDRKEKFFKKILIQKAQNNRPENGFTSTFMKFRSNNPPSSQENNHEQTYKSVEDLFELVCYLHLSPILSSLLSSFFYFIGATIHTRIYLNSLKMEDRNGRFTRCNHRLFDESIHNCAPDSANHVPIMPKHGQNFVKDAFFAVTFTNVFSFIRLSPISIYLNLQKYIQ